MRFTYKQKIKREEEKGAYRLSGGLSSRWAPSGWDLFLPLGIEDDSSIAGD
jgi:hypothetical protein